MATSTQTNIASLTSLIADLVAFAVASAGFTDEGTDLSGTEPLYRISKTVDGQLMYWWFKQVFEERGVSGYSKYRIHFGMKLILPTDTNAEQNISGPRYATRMGAYDFPGPYTKYIFNTEGTCIFMTLECSSGVYTHLSFGNLTKCGTFTGGAYTTACNAFYYPYAVGGPWMELNGNATSNASPNLFGARYNSSANGSAANGCGYVHFDKGGGDQTDFAGFNAGYDKGFSGSRGVSGTMSPNTSAGTGSTGSYLSSTSSCFINPNASMIYGVGTSTSTLRAPIFPIQIYRQSDAAPANLQLLGSIPNIGNIRITYLSPEETVNTDWVVYPFSQKDGDRSVSQDSGDWGVAYKVVP